MERDMGVILEVIESAAPLSIGDVFLNTEAIPCLPTCRH